VDIEEQRQGREMKLVVQRILVMRYRFIGDTVLTVPFLRNLREAFPGVRIDLMLEPFSGQVIEGCPYVDRVIPFELRTIHKYSARNDRGKVRAYLHYRRMIRRERYDAVFVLKRSLSSALLVWAARVPRRIGFATEGRSLFLTDPVPYRNDQHEVENFLDSLRALAIPVRSSHLELWTDSAIDAKVDSLLSQAGWNDAALKVIIHAAASLPAKEWPLDRFAAVMRVLRDRYGARFVYTGAKDDSFRYEEIERLGSFGGLNLCGVTSVRENIAVYRSCDLFFGVDSGPMHMAAAAGVPVVALFGPTDERKWGPWGTGHVVISKRLACHPCRPHKCPENECMDRITVPEVLSALEGKIRTIVPKKRGKRS
jgi:heptosyltransferase-2